MLNDLKSKMSLNLLKLKIAQFYKLKADLKELERDDHKG